MLESRRVRERFEESSRKTESIILENGWNANVEYGGLVVASRSMWSISAGEVFEYQGGCDHDEYGWAIQLKDCDLTIPASNFETCFRKIV